MLRNFIKTAYRNIVKHGIYSIINFVGLTCGLGLALLIFVYVRSEISYDRFHALADRLYRIRYTAPNELQIASAPPPLAVYLKDFFPEVEEAARIYQRNVSITLPDDPEAYEETGILFADSALMKMFTFEFVRGNPINPLADKFTVIINEQMARKYFGDDDPIGASLVFSGRKTFKVIAVVKDFPPNSHLHFNMLVPYDNMFDLETDETAQLLRNNLTRNWIISHSYTYVLVKPGTRAADLDERMDEFVAKYAPQDFQVGQVFALMPLTSIHLNNELRAEPSPTNSKANLLIFVGVGILTLVVASINYINLSTAQSYARVKEIGIRKIFGSMKHQLIVQFLAESFLFCLASMVFAFVILYVCLPWLNQLSDKQLMFNEVVDRELMVNTGVLLVLITVMAGAYPAYFVTQFESVRSLKGIGSASGNDQFMRKALVVFQLSIACMLLSGSLLIFQQLTFLRSRPLGFQKDQIINIPLFSQNFNGIFSRPDSTFAFRLQTYRDFIEQQSGVSGTSLSSGAPGLGVTFRNTIPEGFTREDNLFAANMSVDYDFLEAYEMELVAGRGFVREYTTDGVSAFIVNETALREFKWGSPQEALGKTIEREGKKGIVIGVVKDFSFASLTTPMSALLLELNPNQFNTLTIKVTNADMEQMLDQLAGAWTQIFPEKAFEFSFLDEQISSQYEQYQHFGTIIQGFTAIAMLIACLGVYGLVLFTVQRKVKEIGVRKVLGAGIRSILGLICRDFAILIVVGFRPRNTHIPLPPESMVVQLY
jgi:putative ABC transport system permease protein